MKEGQAIQDHLKCMKEISDKLAALGSAVAEEEQVVAMLIGLPPRYGTLVTDLEAKGEDLSLLYVQQALVNEEQKRQVSKRRAAAGNRDSALQVDKPSKPFKGKKEGHKASEYREEKWTKYSLIVQRLQMMKMTNRNCLSCKQDR